MPAKNLILILLHRDNITASSGFVPIRTTVCGFNFLICRKSKSILVFFIIIAPQCSAFNHV